jgi:hypothetical protein
MRTSALTRVKRRNARDLLESALALAREGLRVGVGLGTGRGSRDRLRRALCTIAERIAHSDAELEPLIADVRCGHRRGRWTRECALNTTGARWRER